MRSLLILFLLLYAVILNGQDEFTRIDNIMNPWTINPAITGSGKNSFNFFAGKQWFGIKDAPVTFGAHINGRLAPFDFYTNRMKLNKTSYKSRGRVGLGAAILSDRSGPFSFTELKLAYSYHIPVDKNYLSFGLSSDFEIYGVNEGIMDPLVDNDPLIQGLSRTKMLYNPGIGVQYYGRSFSTGIAINNIFKDNIILRDDYIVMNDVSTVFCMHGSYIFKTPYGITVEPGLLLGTGSDDFLFDISGTTVYDDIYMLKITYRSTGNIYFHAGAEFDRYGLAYGYSVTTGTIRKYTYGSHQITLSVKFGQYVY